MIAFQPVPIARRLGQGGPLPLPPAPAGTPSTVQAAPEAAPANPFLAALKWGVIGFGAGAATGYLLGKGAGSRAGGLMDSLLGGVGGVVATVLPRLLGLS